MTTKTPVSMETFAADGNVFAVLGVARRALVAAGRGEDSTAMIGRVTNSGSYDAAVAIILEYVDPVPADELMTRKDMT